MEPLPTSANPPTEHGSTIPFFIFFPKEEISTTCFLNIGKAQEYLWKGEWVVGKSQQQQTQQQTILKLLFVFFPNPSSVKQNTIHIWQQASYGRCHIALQDLLQCSVHEYFRLTIRQCARTAAYSERNPSGSLEEQSVWKEERERKKHPMLLF